MISRRINSVEFSTHSCALRARRRAQRGNQSYGPEKLNHHNSEISIEPTTERTTHTHATMCQVRKLPSSLENSPSQHKIRAARKIVKKYRKHEEKRELEKLRQLLPAQKNSPKLKKKQVIDETISLIMDLEKQLMAKIQRQGSVPSQLSHTGLQPQNINLDSLRTAMSFVLPQRPFILSNPQMPNFSVCQ